MKKISSLTGVGEFRTFQVLSIYPDLAVFLCFTASLFKAIQLTWNYFH